MQTDRLRLVKENVGCVLYPHIPTPAIYAYVIVLILGYTIVLLHTPLTVHPSAAHDDGLYMTLGHYIAVGKWLGPFNQFTLMKGPGFPAFLALGHWLGISISLAHALFHCAAITFFVAVAHRFVRSLLLSGLLLALLLWHPISMTVPLLRVAREQIFYGQILVLLAALLCALFYPSENKRRNLFAALGGAVFGWFWLTREEGVWIIPALALLLAVAAFRAFREQRIRQLLGILLIFFGVFAATQIGFRGINWLAYGKFMGVDSGERNFQRTLKALNSVRSGGVQPFVTITRAARERVYAVSPTFASLSAYLDTPPDAGWAKITCDSVPFMCGEIGSGWFYWAVRDAAAVGGHYRTPAAASAFFGRLADEILAACARGALECSPQLIDAIPPVSWQEIAERLPSRLLVAYYYLTLPNPSLQLDPSSGTQDQLDASVRFLNYPLHTMLSQIPWAAAAYTLSGWYYKSGREWILLEVKGADGSLVEARVDRNPSADLQQGFKDPAASHQRFVIRTRCNDECMVQFQAQDGKTAAMSLAELRRAPFPFNVGEGRVHVDSTEVRSNPTSSDLRSEEICNTIRMAIVSHYSLVFLPLLVLGLAAFLATTLLRWRRAASNICYILALVSWLLVVLRTALLILIEVTSFHALNPQYLTPAYFFLVCGAIFSCAAWLQLFHLAPDGEMGAPALADS